MALLGHIIFSDRIRVNTQKIKAVQSWPIPTSPIDIRSFLSLDRYYRRFVEGFSSISSRLTKLTQKTVKFLWSESCEKKVSGVEKEIDDHVIFDFTGINSRFYGLFGLRIDAKSKGYSLCL